jgi:hypothetical protein
MENRYQKMKASVENLNEDISMAEAEISSILLKILEVAGYRNKKVFCTAEFMAKYRDRYNKAGMHLIDFQFTATILHKDMKLLNPKASEYEQLGDIVEFLKRFFDIDNKNDRRIKIYNAGTKEQAAITFDLSGTIGKLYEVSELDDESLKLLIELKK